MKNNFSYFQNTSCKYFPCHTCEGEYFNCLFCYCPLYALGDECGGNFTYTEQGIIEYPPGNVTNNLTAILAFYSLFIIGLDFDTMSPMGGTDILREAESLAANSQMLGTGWRSFDNNSNRYSIIND